MYALKIKLADLTDWRGYAVMPYATVYRYNRIALEYQYDGEFHRC
ncbi:hypothetical protein ACLB1T_20415 [Escherichia coli]